MRRSEFCGDSRVAKFNAAFWKWFGDSKVVDAKGQPLVVYHGTADAFVKFKKSTCGRYSGNKYPCSAFFFADKANEASGYASAQDGHPDDRPNVMPVYLSIQRAVLIDAKGGSWAFMSKFDPKYWGTQEDAFELAIKNRCDGIIFKNIHDHGNVKYGQRKPYTVYVVFKPTQIKSATGNDGTWDGDDPDIRSNPGDGEVRVSEVIDNLRETDQTGDKEWVRGLIKQVKDLKAKWFVGDVKLSEIIHGNTSDENDLLEDYGSGVDDFPPIVLVPSDDAGYRYEAIDGGHRAATAELLGRKTIRAYYPEIESNRNLEVEAKRILKQLMS